MTVFLRLLFYLDRQGFKKKSSVCRLKKIDILRDRTVAPGSHDNRKSSSSPFMFHA